MEIISARCVTRSKCLPEQIKVGDQYLVATRSIYVDNNGDVYGQVYTLAQEPVGQLKMNHFVFENVVTDYTEEMVHFLFRTGLIKGGAPMMWATICCTADSIDIADSALDTGAFYRLDVDSVWQDNHQELHGNVYTISEKFLGQFPLRYFRVTKPLVLDWIKNKFCTK